MVRQTAGRNDSRKSADEGIDFEGAGRVTLLCGLGRIGSSPLVQGAPVFQLFLGGPRGGDEQTQAKPACRRTLPRIEGLEERCTPALFVVNTVMDTPDANPGNGVAADARGNTSLRAAIDEGNKAAGPHTVTFNPPVGENVIWLGSDGAFSGNTRSRGTWRTR